MDSYGNRYIHSQSTSASRIAFCGFGARGRLAFICGVAQDVANLWQGKPVNKQPRTHDYYEVQLKQEGPGVSFQTHSKAGLNTKLESPVPLDLDGLTVDQQHTLSCMTDLAGHYAHILMADPRKTLSKLESENVSTAILFARASQSGTLDTSIACGPRNVVGEALEAMTIEAMELASEHLPWLTINFFFGTNIIDINLRDLQKPVITTQHQEDGRKDTIAYDLFVKTTGTTYEVPVNGKVCQMAFTDVPNDTAIWQYMNGMKLIRIDGMIRPGTRILIGGSSLSAFDPVGILLTRTGILRLDLTTPTGFSIDIKRARQYPDLITFFNRSQGELVASRHTHTAFIPDETATLFTPEMILSQQLQRVEDPCQVYLQQARLLTALQFNKHPLDIEPRLKTMEQFRRMAKENRTLAANSGEPPEPSMMRAALLSFFFFFALGSDPAAKQTKLAKQYPLLVRHGWDACSLLENMFARQNPEPVEHLMNLYLQTLPDPISFQEQATALKGPYEESHSIIVFARLLAQAYTNGEMFSAKMKVARDRQARHATVQELRKSSAGNIQNAIAAYDASIEKIEFNPFDLAGFEATSPDFSATQIKEMKRLYEEELRREYLVRMNAAWGTHS